MRKRCLLVDGIKVGLGQKMCVPVNEIKVELGQKVGLDMAK